MHTSHSTEYAANCRYITAKPTKSDSRTHSWPRFGSSFHRQPCQHPDRGPRTEVRFQLKARRGEPHLRPAAFPLLSGLGTLYTLSLSHVRDPASMYARRAFRNTMDTSCHHLRSCDDITKTMASRDCRRPKRQLRRSRSHRWTLCVPIRYVQCWANKGLLRQMLLTRGQPRLIS